MGSRLRGTPYLLSTLLSSAVVTLAEQLSEVETTYDQESHFLVAGLSLLKYCSLALKKRRIMVNIKGMEPKRACNYCEVFAAVSGGGVMVAK